MIQLAAILLLLGRGGMKPRRYLPKHYLQYIPYRYHIDAEGVTEGSTLLKQCDGCRRLAWKGNIILKDWCTSNCHGIQRGIVLRRDTIFVPQNDILTGYIGKGNTCDSRAMLKLLNHNFKGLSKVLEGGLGKAVGLVLKGQLHLALLAKRDDVLLGQCFKVNFA
jgi:hypothetical protein